MLFVASSCVVESGVSETVSEADRACDDDVCVEIALACCGCHQLGSLTAVRADAVDAVRARCEAEPRTCSDAISQDPTCTIETHPECVNGRCELVR